MRRRYNKFSAPMWVKTVKRYCEQFIIPICIFQGIRTILLPTIFDVLLLVILILFAVAIYLDMI
jgi:hypothetical protein